MNIDDSCRSSSTDPKLHKYPGRNCNRQYHTMHVQPTVQVRVSKLGLCHGSGEVAATPPYSWYFSCTKSNIKIINANSIFLGVDFDTTAVLCPYSARVTHHNMVPQTQVQQSQITTRDRRMANILGATLASIQEKKGVTK